MSKLPINIGDRYGRGNVVVADVGRRSHRDIIVGLECDCGNYYEAAARRIVSGHTKSCGCYQKDRARETKTTHGYAPSKNIKRTYRIWAGMISRCYRECATGFGRYGKRGIRVCVRWRNSFEAFLEDMGDPPSGTTLERINNDGNYEPGNCRWADQREQARNTRRNVSVAAYDKDGNFVVWYAIMDDAKYDGYRPASISAVVHKRQGTHRDLYWIGTNGCTFGINILVEP